MGTTPSGLPYPEPTDPVAAGADNIRDLAEAVDASIDSLDTSIDSLDSSMDSRFGKLPDQILWGRSSATTSAGGTVYISFSRGFSGRPAVTVTCEYPGTSIPGVAHLDEVQPGFFRVKLFLGGQLRANAAAPFSWIAAGDG